MCLHFDSKDHFIQAMAATSATENLARFVKAARKNEAFYERTSSVIQRIVGMQGGIFIDADRKVVDVKKLISA